MLALGAPFQQRLFNRTHQKDIKGFIYLKFLQCLCFKLQQIFRVKLSVHLPLIGQRNSCLTFGPVNADTEPLYSPKLAEVFLRHYIFNISYEKIFLVILKVELPQLKPGKTLKNSKILLIFADVNKILQLFHFLLCFPN